MRLTLGGTPREAWNGASMGGGMKIGASAPKKWQVWLAEPRWSTFLTHWPPAL
jgi:hypothetical protein